jgi:hypothetical protein
VTGGARRSLTMALVALVFLVTGLWSAETAYTSPPSIEPILRALRVVCERHGMTASSTNEGPFAVLSYKTHRDGDRTRPQVADRDGLIIRIRLEATPQKGRVLYADPAVPLGEPHDYDWRLIGLLSRDRKWHLVGDFSTGKDLPTDLIGELTEKLRRFDEDMGKSGEQDGAANGAAVAAP